MSLPPKDDDAGSAPARKTKRAPRGRVRKTKVEDAAAPFDAGTVAPAAKPEAPPPAPPAESPAPQAREERGGRGRDGGDADRRDAGEAAARAEDRGPAPSGAEPQAPAASDNGGPAEGARTDEHSGEGPPGAPRDEPRHHGHQGRGDWQGGQRGDREFWKRNKRKRGRWQPGGPGGQQGGFQHPPQPPPPSSPQVYGDLPNPARFADPAALDALAAEISSGDAEPIELQRLYALPLAELTAAARSLGVAFEGVPNRRALLAAIFLDAAAKKRAIRDTGYVDLTDRGAFIVHEHVNYRLYPEDPYLPDSLIRRYGLKRGHRVEVLLQAPAENDRCPAVVRVDSVMGLPPGEISKLTPFEELIPYYPLQRILLEAPEVQKDVSMRAVDILTPIGFGQRGLIVAPPRTGKTVLLQNIANSVSENSPEVKLILLLIDERPEEVTDFKRHTKGEVVSSTFDESPESHVHCAEMVGEKARRLVERGQHVVILLDSITRLARAYNALASNSGKIMSGGMEATALQKPKRFFGAARNIEGGGSITIIATALIDTGSRMDEVIFEEFKGTGNMELHLDRGLVERRVFPAINIDRSGTRKEELIYHPEELQRIYGLRRAMQGLGPIESMEMLITRLKKTKSNAEFLLTLSRQ
ncbi:MAG TPA: transcription termination factor Rho [Opitutaceae bacterium]|jgi:transcription termination factor Rho|nr:transcription termination factor Rho [Opitutaceae bacterium]